MATHVYLPKSQPMGRGWCGPACLANALAIYGIPTSLEECAGACFADPNVGINTDQLKKGMKRFGFKGNLKEVLDRNKATIAFRWLRKQTDGGKFVICSINGHYSTGHWILILRVTNRGIHVWDPNEDGSKVITKSNLLTAWWNITVPNDPDQSQPSMIELLAMSPRSKLARRATIIRSNLVDPPKGKLPLVKDTPESFEQTEENEHQA